MREYHEVFGPELPPLPREPALSDFYTLTDEQHYRELGFIVLSMIFVLSRELNYITNRNITDLSFKTGIKLYLSFRTGIDANTP